MKNNEVEVDITDVFRKLAIRLVNMLLAFAVGAVLGLFYWYAKPEQKASTLDKYSESEVLEAKDAYNRYKDAVKNQSTGNKQLELEAVNQLDTDALYETRVYRLKTTMHNPDVIVNSAVTFTDAEKKQIIKANKFDKNTTNLDSLVNVNFVLDNSKFTGGDFSFSYSVLGENDKSLSTVFDILEKHIADESSKLSTSNVQFDVANLTSIVENGSEEVTQAQQTMVQKENDYSKAVSDITNQQMSDNGKELFNNYVKNKGKYVGDEAVTKSKKDAVKYSIGFGLLIWVLYCLVVALKETTKNAVGTGDEVSEGLHIYKFGLISKSNLEDKDNYQKYLYNKWKSEDKEDVAESQIVNKVLSLDAEEQQKVYIRCATKNSIIEADKIAEKLRDEGIKVTTGSPLTDSKEMDTMLNSTLLIVIAGSDEKQEDIYKVVNAADEESLYTIGMLVIKDIFEEDK